MAPPVPRVMAPDQVLAPARLRRAPVPPTPVPMRLVTGSAIARPAPSISIAAPEATVVPVAVVPRAVAAWTRTMPALDRGGAGVGVGAREGERAGAGLDERAAGGGDDTADGGVAGSGDGEGPGRPAIPAVVRVPASEATVAPPVPRVMAPDQVLAPARLRRAPVPLTPVPMRLVTGSVIMRPAPSISIAAPEATVVPVAVVPRAVAAWTRTIPPLTVVAPV